MKRLKSIKQIAHEFGISESILYSQIKTEPTFPVINIGRKKKFVIDPTLYLSWLQKRTNRSTNFSGEDLLRRYRK